MAKTWKILFLTLLALSLTFVTTVRVNAQEYANINAGILPTQGGANTTILLTFLTTSSSVGNVTTADIFWDNNTVAFNESGVLGASGAYDYNLTVPNEPPLSDQGDHTIQVDSYVLPYKQVSFYFTFNVTEFVPSPEYSALLANYTNILGNYTQLQSSYTELSANYTTLMAEYNNATLNYNTLVSTYTVLNANYNSLSTNYIYLSNNYGNLTAVASSLSTNYAGLQTSFQTLGSNYSTLLQDYSLLNSSYASLVSNYNGVVGQLDFSRNLNIALVIITIALALTTVYFVMIKPKRPTKTR
jgi:hypothetical protein